MVECNLIDEHTEEELEFLYGDRHHYTDVENKKNLLDVFYSHADVDDFLRDGDVHIPLFPTAVDRSKDSINYAHDIDGIVIELREITALKASLHYLLLTKVVGVNLQTHWHSLKKRLPLSDFSADGISTIKKTFGHTLGFVDGGYL